MHQPELDVLWSGALFIGRSWVRYMAVAGAAFLVFWVIFAKRFRHRRCQDTIPERRIQLIEFKNSLLGIVFFIAPTILSLPLYNRGFFKLEMDHSATPPWIMVVSFIGFIIGADAWFYWAHRLMHNSKVYRWTHQLHHISVQPSPFAGYAFSIIEGLVLGAYFPFVLTFVPMNVLVITIFVIWFSLMEAYVHLGFELLPRWVARNPVTKWLGTAVFHDLHHEDGAYNFGVYFTWWDRIMGTIHPKYTERYERVTEHKLFWRPPVEGVAEPAE